MHPVAVLTAHSHLRERLTQELIASQTAFPPVAHSDGTHPLNADFPPIELQCKSGEIIVLLFSWNHWHLGHRPGSAKADKLRHFKD